MISASRGWSAIVASSGVDIPVGYAVTLSADNRGMVPATTANIAASPSGAPAGIAFTPGSPNQGVNIESTGVIDPELVPFVGPGADLEYAVVDALGRVVRSPTYTNNAVGIAYKDGSVAIVLGMWGALIGAGGGALINTAIVDGAVSQGDVLAPTNNVSDSGRLVRATSANIAAGVMPKGIALTAPVLGIVVYAAIGSSVSASVIGLGAGTATWAVVNSVGRVVRKDAPEASDVVIGSVLPEGHLLVDPWRPDTSEVVVTHPPFNAKNDASVDASDAFRAAIAACQKELLINGSSRALRIPAGDYLINKPLHVKFDGGNRIFGEGNHTTNLRSVTMSGPVWYVAPDRGEFPHDTNVFAGGSAIRMRQDLQNLEHWLPISMSGAGHWFHGKSSFCFRAIISVKASTTTGAGFVFCSFGRRGSDDAIGGLAEAYGIGVTGTTGNVVNRALFFTLTTTAGIQTIYTPTDSMMPGGFVEVQCNWDGTNMRMFIGGTLQTLNTGGTARALAGTIVQRNYESVTIGGGYTRQFNNREFAMADTDIASLALDVVAVNTTTYTPTGAKLAVSANTSLECQFDTYDGIFVVGSTRAQTNSSSRSAAYWPHRQDQIATMQMPDVTIEDMYVGNLYGPAIGAEGATRFGVRNVEGVAKNGIRADNNCYIGIFENIKFVGSGATQLPTYCISLVGAAHVESIRNIASQDYDYHIIAIGSGDMAIDGYWYPGGYADQYLLAYNGFSLSLIGDIAFSDEGSPTAPSTFMNLITMNNVVFAGGQFGQSVAGAGPLVTIQGENGMGALDLDMNARFGAHPSCPGIFKVLGTVTGITTARGYKTAGIPIATSGSTAGARIVWEPALYKTGAVALPDANYTLTRDDHLARHIQFTGTLTAGRSVFFPARDIGPRSVFNATAQTLTFSVTGGAITWAVTAGAGATFAPNAAATELDRVG